MPHAPPSERVIPMSGPADAAALARTHGPLVFRAAYRVLGDQSRAEDVQQEVFLRLLETSRDGIASWPAYLTATATRIAIDVLRRRQRWWGLLPMLAAQTATAAPSAEAAGIEAQRATRLRAALATLPAREAQCFALRYRAAPCGRI